MEMKLKGIASKNVVIFLIGILILLGVVSVATSKDDGKNINNTQIANIATTNNTIEKQNDITTNISNKNKEEKAITNTIEEKNVIANEKNTNIVATNTSVNKKQTTSTISSKSKTTTKSSNTSKVSSKTTSKANSTTKTTPTGQTVYVTPTGKRYHYSPTCGGKNSKASTLSQAKSMGLTPCQKCAQ